MMHRFVCQAKGWLRGWKRSGDCLSCVGRIEGILGLHKLLDRVSEQSLDIAPYLLALAEGLNPAFGGPVKVSAECESLMLDPRTCGIVGLIFNEAKYSFPNGHEGQVNASFRSLANQHHLTVSDNGRGYDPREAKEGYGTKVMKIFASQLSGEIEVTTGSHGTSVSLAFPRAVPTKRSAAQPDSGQAQVCS
jgi:two-component sensor histidine kinase